MSRTGDPNVPSLPSLSVPAEAPTGPWRPINRQHPFPSHRLPRPNHPSARSPLSSLPAPSPPFLC
ncbi:hypothetical protein OEIGOIKO_07526 [Streptomyces chrestomyceticus JCM 4735]|uniref:Uncharacterized protein n=1 Tax=Streptomyces chrestomyceticus JCM 4735 TaxID=1306181 RepID=A0A7U9Q2N4_9ACTN|nr:hypothetical protein OEIGOIKO_07526 [Streptomyces chrestomyceticus JCM 4735]